MWCNLFPPPPPPPFFFDQVWCNLCSQNTCLGGQLRVQLLKNSFLPRSPKARSITSSITSCIAYHLPGHNVPAITDTYKVFVSQKMMYLEPYIQRGLHEHFCPLRYDVCSYGAGVMDKRDRWDQYEFKVRIRKPTH